MESPGQSPSARGSQLTRAVRRLQAAVRSRLHRRRRTSSWFEIEVQSDWGLQTVPRRRRSYTRADQRCCGGAARRRSCRAAALVCTTFLALAVYWTAAIVNLLSTGGESLPILDALHVGSVCTSRVSIGAVVHWEWRAWSTIVVDTVALELRSESLGGGSSLLLAHGSFPGPTLSRSLRQPIVVNASLDLAEPSVASPPLHRLLAIGDATLALTARATVRSPSLTGPFRMTVTLPFTARVACVNFTCALDGGGGSPSQPSPPPAPPPVSPWRLPGATLHLSSGADASLSLAASIEYNQSDRWPVIEAALPPIAASLSCATPPDEDTDRALETPPPDEGAAVVTLDGASASGGAWSARVGTRLHAASTVQGRQLRGMAHAGFACARGQNWCAAAPTVFARFQPATEAAAAAAEQPSECYLSRVLSDMPPLPLAILPNLRGATGAGLIEGDADEGARAGKTPAARLHGGSAFGRFGVSKVKIAALSVDETAARMYVSGRVDLPWRITGDLPAFEWTLGDEAVAAASPAATPAAEQSPLASIRLEQPLSLARLPALATRLHINISTAAVSLAAALLQRASHANATLLALALASHSIGLPLHAAKGRPAGLSELRAPLNWLVSPADLPAYRPPPKSDAKSPSVNLHTLAVNGTTDVRRTLLGSLEASLNASGALPAWLRLSSGGTLIAALECQHSRQPIGTPPPALPPVLNLTLEPMTVDGGGDGSADVKLTAAVNPSALHRISSACPDASFHGLLCPTALRRKAAPVAAPPSCGVVLLSLSTVQGLAKAWSGGGGGSVSHGSSEGRMGNVSVNVSVHESSDRSSAAIHTHACLPLRAPIGVATPPLELTLRSGGEGGDAVASVHLDALHADAGEALSLHGALILSVSRRDALGALIDSARRREARVCAVGGLGGANHAVSACFNMHNLSETLRASTAAPAGDGYRGESGSSWLNIGGLTLEAIAVSGTADLVHRNLSADARLMAGTSLPLAVSLPWLQQLEIPAVSVRASVAVLADRGPGSVMTAALRAKPLHLMRPSESATVTINSTLTAGPRLSAAWREPSLLSSGLRVTINGSSQAGALSRCLPTLSFDVGSNGGNAGHLGGGSAPRFGVNVTVAERPAASTAVASINVALPLASPLALVTPPLELTLRSGSDGGDAIASVHLDALHADAGKALSLHGALILSVSRRDALGALIDSATSGRLVRVCIDGGRPGGDATMDACLVGGAKVTNNASSESWLENWTVELLGPSTLAVPCVFPFFFCSRRTREQLHALPPTTAVLDVSMPLPPPLFSLLHEYSVHVSLPPTPLDMGLDYFDRIGTLRLPHLFLTPSSRNVTLAVEASVLDWYALSRVTHPYGRAYGTEHRYRTARVRGSHSNSSWACVLPQLFTTRIPPPSNGSTFHLPTPLYYPHPSPTDPPPIQLVATAAGSATFKAPLGFDSPLPFAVVARNLALSLSVPTPDHPSGITVAQIVAKNTTLRLPPGQVTQIELIGTVHAGSGDGSCLVPACYTDDELGCERKMCALGRLFESFTASDRLSVGAAVSVRSRDKAQIDLRSNLTLFDDPTQQIDSIDTYKRRDTQVLADMAASRLNPSPLSALVWTSLDVWDSIEESILHGIDHDKSFDAYMTLNLTNVFSAPVALSKYMIGSLLLQDVDGVEPHAVLMAATLFHADFAPNTRHEMGSHFSSKIQPTVLLPGEQMSTKVTVPMHWESVVRYMDGE